MSFFGALLGTDAADASRKAAADTYGKQQQAITGITNYGDQYANKYADLAQPYSGAGGQLQSLISNPDSVRSLPGYQFAQDQGIQAIDRSANARHMLNSGREQKDLMRFGTGLADQTYGSQLSRLMGLVGANNTTVGQGLQGQLGTRQSAYSGGMNAAGTIGQGDVAAAGAEAAGAQNILNAAAKIGGMALGGPIGGMIGGSLGSLMGGSVNPGVAGGGYLGTGGSVYPGPGYYK